MKTSFGSSQIELWLETPKTLNLILSEIIVVYDEVALHLRRFLGSLVGNYQLAVGVLQFHMAHFQYVVVGFEHGVGQFQFSARSV